MSFVWPTVRRPKPRSPIVSDRKLLACPKEVLMDAPRSCQKPVSSVTGVWAIPRDCVTFARHTSDSANPNGETDICQQFRAQPRTGILQKRNGGWLCSCATSSQPSSSTAHEPGSKLDFPPNRRCACGPSIRLSWDTALRIGP